MEDLHSEDSVINRYADRYRSYMPINIRNGRRNTSLDASNSSHSWDATLPLTITEDVSRDKALGSLVGLAAGDAVGTTLEFKKRDSEYVEDMIGGGPFQLNLVNGQMIHPWHYVLRKLILRKRMHTMCSENIS
jgi:hypothetical protein